MNASAASYFARSSFETASAESVPPAARLAPNNPIVPTNQRAKTNHRWRALQSAMRTVQGTPDGRSADGAVSAVEGVDGAVMGAPGAAARAGDDRRGEAATG